MLIDAALVIVGFVLLIKGADMLIDGSVGIAKKMKVSTLIIGLTIVALGTSMPEFIINVFGALTASSEVPMGNIIGSNMANTLLILGGAAIVTPLLVKSSTVWREIPFNLFAVGVLFIMMQDGSLSRADGIIMLMITVGYIYYIMQLAKSGKASFDEEEDILSHKHSMKMITFLILAGLVSLFIGGKWVVDGAVGIASTLGMSQFMIASTIIAFGTSLPELVTAIMAARKKDSDLIVGGIVGSNILNIVFVLGTTATISSIATPAGIMKDMHLLIATTVVLFVFVYIGHDGKMMAGIKKIHSINRNEGIIMLMCYIGYITFLITRG